MRGVSKSAYSHRRPQTTAPQQPTSTYKYLTLSPRSNSNLTPYFPSVTRILNKIGTSKKNSMFEPDVSEKKNYNLKRYRQLKQEFSQKQRDRSKFEFEVDEIVLDCYDYAQEHSRRSIWRNYRSKVDELSYEVMRLKQNAKGSVFS